ncbi:hypothetical protein F4604DRAFT_1722714, partial [Suillus subluteus]
LVLRYPLGLVIIVLLSLLVTSIVFEHHDVLVEVFVSPISFAVHSVYLSFWLGAQ